MTPYSVEDGMINKYGAVDGAGISTGERNIRRNPIPDRRSGDLATNHLSYGTASIQENQMTSWTQLDACRHLAGFLLGLLFVTEDEGDVFLGHLGLLSPDYTALYPRKQKSA
jgi:hypothetical protein